MGRPTDAPLQVQYFQGGSRLTRDKDGLRRYLNELEARQSALLTTTDIPLAPVFTNASRPVGGAQPPAGAFIFNSDDNALNISDGTNWRDAVGVIT